MVNFPIKIHVIFSSRQVLRNISFRELVMTSPPPKKFYLPPCSGFPVGGKQSRESRDKENSSRIVDTVGQLDQFSIVLPKAQIVPQPANACPRDGDGPFHSVHDGRILAQLITNRGQEALSGMNDLEIAIFLTRLKLVSWEESGAAELRRQCPHKNLDFPILAISLICPHNVSTVPQPMGETVSHQKQTFSPVLNRRKQPVPYVHFASPGLRHD